LCIIFTRKTVFSIFLLFQGVTTGTAYDFSDLEPGHEYGFAVKAANAVGESDPLPTAKLILAKDQFCKF